MEKQTFKAFYPAYLAAHSDAYNKVLHFIGASLFFVCVITAFATQYYWLIIVAIAFGYVLPGIGHKHYEKNNSFRVSKPFYCVAGATKMYFDTWKQIINQIFKKKNK